MCWVTLHPLLRDIHLKLPNMYFAFAKIQNKIKAHHAGIQFCIPCWQNINLRQYRERFLSGVSQNQNQSNCLITFDTQLKTPLWLRCDYLSIQRVRFYYRDTPKEWKAFQYHVTSWKGYIDPNKTMITRETWTSVKLYFNMYTITIIRQTDFITRFH